jgi:plasmid rolling circle replication initiator protein Rep
MIVHQQYHKTTSEKVEDVKIRVEKWGWQVKELGKIMEGLNRSK